MTSSLHQQVRRTIRRHALCPPGVRVLIGVSGGSDSVALTCLMLELAENGGYTVAGLAHLNHGLRPSARDDEVFCRTFAERMGLPITVEQADVRGCARTRMLSVEDAARRLRYAFLERAAAGAGADRVAVGHTQDDQAETLLLKLMRGAGLTGLAGIHPRRGEVIRPLLDVTRADLRAFLVSRGEGWMEDETNENLDNPRNRIRHRVLPELDRAAGAAAGAAIARAAALIREDGAWLDDIANGHYQALAEPTDTGLELDGTRLVALPAPMCRRVVLQAMRNVGGREVGLDHVEGVLGLLEAGRGGVDVPGSRVELRAGKLVLVQQAGARR